MSAVSNAFPPQVQRSAPAATRIRSWIPAALIVWLVMYGIMIAMTFGVLERQEFHDPDDQLRLQQVRDLLAGQSWFDLHQYRIAAHDGGVLMHWSRLVDLPIAAVILLLRPLFGTAASESAAFVAVPAVTLLAIVLIIGWMGSRVLPRAAAIFSMVAVAFSAPLVVQVIPARIDHHGWQIVLALAAVAAFLDRDGRRGGFVTGAALATWMAISFEGLPLSAWIIALTGLWAVQDDRLRPRLVAMIQALALVSAALFIATRGLDDLASHCDAVSPIHLAVFAWGAAAISAANLLRPQSRAMLVAGLATGAAGAVVLVIGTAPQCASGTFDMLDPVVRDFWLTRVLEGLPVTRYPPYVVAQFILPPVIGLFAAITLARRSQDEFHRWWVFYSAVLAGALVLGFFVSRASAISGALAVLPLGWWIFRWLGSLRRPNSLLLRVGELVGVAAIIFLTLLPVVPATAITRLFESKPISAEKDESRLACNTALARDAIDQLPPGGMLAPMDIGPDILIRTNKSVLSTGHHRGARTMRQTIDAFRGTPEQARIIMASENLRYVSICPELGEHRLYRMQAPDGLAARLEQGRVPGWLRPVPLPAASGLKMWMLAE